MRSQQTGSDTIPPKEDGDLALIIKCPGCDTQRAFRVNNAVMLTLTRKGSGAEYSTVCSVCERRITVQLVWTQRHLGWVSEKVVFKSAVTVEDDFIMRKTKGEKQI